MVQVVIGLVGNLDLHQSSLNHLDSPQQLSPGFILLEVLAEGSSSGDAPRSAGLVEDARGEEGLAQRSAFIGWGVAEDDV